MEREKALAVQTRLKELGLYAGLIDGDIGPRSLAAIRAFQRVHGLKADGIVGPKTWAELFPAAMPERDVDPPDVPPGAWPRQRDVEAFYGPPGGDDCTAGVVSLPAPMRVAWNLNQRVRQFNCHAKVAAPMTAIFNETFQHYGEKQWREIGLDLFGGCFNVRKMRGGTRLSMHSWGIAYDCDPARNQLKWGRDRAELAKPVYIPFWNIVESKGALSLGRAANRDFMHFQFARL